MVRFELCLHLRFSFWFCSVVKAHIDTPGRKLCNQTVSPGFTGRPNRGCGAGTFGLMMGGKLVLVVFGWLFGSLFADSWWHAGKHVSNGLCNRALFWNFWFGGWSQVFDLVLAFFSNF